MQRQRRKIAGALFVAGIPLGVFVSVGLGGMFEFAALGVAALASGAPGTGEAIYDHNVSVRGD